MWLVFGDSWGSQGEPGHLWHHAGKRPACPLEQKVRQVERLRRMSFSPPWSILKQQEQWWIIDGSYLPAHPTRNAEVPLNIIHIQPQHPPCSNPSFSASPNRSSSRRSSDRERRTWRWSIWKSSRNQRKKNWSTHGLDVVLQSFCPRKLCVFSSDPLLQQALPLFTIVYHCLPNDPDVHHRCSSFSCPCFTVTRWECPAFQWLDDPTACRKFLLTLGISSRRGHQRGTSKPAASMAWSRAVYRSRRVTWNLIPHWNLNQPWSNIHEHPNPKMASQESPLAFGTAK